MNSEQNKRKTKVLKKQKKNRKTKPKQPIKAKNEKQNYQET